MTTTAKNNNNIFENSKQFGIFTIRSSVPKIRDSIFRVQDSEFNQVSKILAKILEKNSQQSRFFF